MGDRWSDVVEDLARYGRVIGQRRRASRDGGGTDWKHSELRARDRALVAALHPPRMRLEVKQVIRETPSAVTLRMRRLDGPLPPFRPGQYVNLFVTVDGVATSRPYSISSRPGLDHLDLTVRERPGGFVSPYLVRRLRAGAVLASTGPKGHFHHEPLTDGDDLVFLAGGSGVTPFVSWLRDAVERGWPQRITLLYGTRVPTDVLFGRELKALARGNPRFTLVVVVSEPPRGFRGVRGFLDAARIRDAVGDVAGKTFYLCGPGRCTISAAPSWRSSACPNTRRNRSCTVPPRTSPRSPAGPAD